MNGPSVLIVDDEPEVLAGMRAALFREPYEVVGASDSGEALAILEATSIDVLISDEKMPGMQGSELLARVRREYPSVVRILLTGHASVASAVKAINDGAVFRYLLKPFPANGLAETLREALRDKAKNDLREQVFEGARQQYEALASYALTLGDVNVPADSRRSPRPSVIPEDALVPEDGSAWERLSERERQIVRRLAAGNDAKTMARALDISVHTVRNHLKAIYRKLGVRSQLEVVSRFAAAPR
jgi:DNA-binding NarL/FixJ family response regulator